MLITRTWESPPPLLVEGVEHPGRVHVEFGENVTDRGGDRDVTAVDVPDDSTLTGVTSVITAVRSSQGIPGVDTEFFIFSHHDRVCCGAISLSGDVDGKHRMICGVWRIIS
jgi:hypothetical protein